MADDGGRPATRTPRSNLQLGAALGPILAVLLGCSPSDSSDGSSSGTTTGGTTGGTTSGGPPGAFAGAQGFGATTPGGRGGRVVEVTNLDDAGPGSLRWALEVESGARIVVFRTGGTVALSTPIAMSGESDSFVTVAGQTAPGGGVQIRDHGLHIRGGAHDIVIRHLRFRPGMNNSGVQDIDGIEMWGNGGAPVHHVVIDHVSLEWARDENASLWDWATDVTFQWCLFAEPMLRGQNGNPGFGMLAAGDAPNRPDRITLHHNLFAHNWDRSPRIGFAATDFRNNVVYNWKGNSNSLFGDAWEDGSNDTPVNVVNNLWIKGPDGFAHHDDAVWAYEGARLYVSGNWGPKSPAGSADGWAIGVRDGRSSPWPPASFAEFGAATEFPYPPVTTDDVPTARDRVFDSAGATKPARDDVDARIVQEVRDGGGAVGMEDNPAYPFLASGIAPADDDHDGMPNAWESARGLDPSDPSDGALDRDGDGYTNVEEYLNELAGGS